MDYEEAAKKIRAEKPKDTFMVLEFLYDCKYVMPHKHGLAVLGAMANAELLNEGYGTTKRIDELERDSVTSRIMSHQEYERFKIAALLNITPDEVKEFSEKAAQPQIPTPI